MTMTQAQGLWVAYGQAGAVGSIRRDEDGYAVTMAGQDEPMGTYPTLEIAKGALCSHLKPGTPRPEFRRH